MILKKSTDKNNKEAKMLNSKSSMEPNAVMTRSTTKSGKQTSTIQSSDYDSLKKTHDVVSNAKLGKDLQK